MSRELAESTIDRFRKRLDDERARLVDLIEEIEQEQEAVRLSETSSERSPDPNTAEGGSLAFEIEKELSLAANAQDLLAQVDEALERIEEGTYGNCARCGQAIPVNRLDALPYTKLDVDCASQRR
ncbi:MAG TPA: TraR/DksA C4-type zinc finger protein [Acidimicrobiia bacterium]|nr:TraR/DksA C4-type zinc finger protein [Acidimicrobiia bacterium]